MFLEQFQDLLVIFFYLLSILILAFYQGREKRARPDDPRAQYLAGNTLSFKESISSIVATETSALTFLGIPAIAFSQNFSFLQIYIGAIFGRLFIARLLLPKLYGKNITAYSSLTESKSKKFLASIFIISKILSVGVRLYSGSILIALFFHISPYSAIFFTVGITFFYTLFGGLKAVVRTDMLQVCLFIFGGLMAHYMIPHIAQLSWSEMISQGFQNGKLSLSLDGSPWGYISGILAGFLFDIATHGTDQDFMQRLLAGRTLKSAQKAIFFSSFASIGTALIFLGVGALLWSYAQSFPFPPEITPDKTFAFFITQHFPTGLKGLMLAGILAATMSTVDSTINAISACLHTDIFSSRKKPLRFYVKRDTFLVSLGLLSIAFIASQSEEILKLGLTIQSWSAGPMLAFFAIFLIFKKSPSLKELFFVLLFGILGVSINTFLLKQSWYWNTYWGMGLGMIFYFIYQRKLRVK